MCLLYRVFGQVLTLFARGGGGALYTELFTAFFVQVKVNQKYQNFLRGIFTNWVKRLTDQPNVSKLKLYFEGFKAFNL